TRKDRRCVSRAAGATSNRCLTLALVESNFDPPPAQPARNPFGSPVHARGRRRLLTPSAVWLATLDGVHPPQTDRPARTGNTHDRLFQGLQSAFAAGSSALLGSRNANPSLQQRKGRTEAGVCAPPLGRYGPAEGQGLG